MIGVISQPSDETIVREFFELFKTPWEFYRPDRQYDVVLSTAGARFEVSSAKLVLIYAADSTALDEELKTQIQSRCQTAILSFGGTSFAIYGNAITFCHHGAPVLTTKGSGETAAYLDHRGDNVVARIGYDLFFEIRTLLTKGQPASNAAIPSLDIHIAFLRHLITSSGIPLVEIPPVPDGYPFIACLTHDVDHASVRRHKFDHTMFGFLHRATLGSVVNAARGRLSLRNLVRNWVAAAKLPLVYMGVAKDFWYDFDRYLEIENGRPSTFFVIPFKDNPGQSATGKAPKARAAQYDVSHIVEKISRLASAGCEIGVHGIDAWIDRAKGREEAKRVSEVSGNAVCGIRMHWLYMDEESSLKLEHAGFCYDSTSGYSEAIGYRAGTSQVFRPLQTTRILELPLHIMDTALFFPGRMHLSALEARELVSPMLDNAVRHGGALTINWHDRSIAPERLWDDFYVELLHDLDTASPWFSTASQAVSWFRRRRSAVFEVAHDEPGKIHVKVMSPRDEKLVGMRLRVHKPQGAASVSDFSFDQSNSYTDVSLSDGMDIRIAV